MLLIDNVFLVIIMDSVSNKFLLHDDCNNLLISYYHDMILLSLTKLRCGAVAGLHFARDRCEGGALLLLLERACCQ